MKKLCKSLLVLTLVLSSVNITNIFQPTPVVAKTINDFTYTVNEGNTVTITNYSGSENVLIIPSELDGMTVTGIGYSAFAECRNLTNLVVPDTVKSIENYAFSHCSALEEVQLPDSIVSIGEFVFKGCTSLKNINIPNKLTYLPTGMFMECSSLETVHLPESLTSIGDNVFSFCQGLTNIELPSNLHNIGSSTFKACTKMENFVLPENLVSIGSNAFADCIALKSINFPNSLTLLGQSAFLNCISLESVELPDTITNLGYSIFSGCSSLANVKLPNGLDAIPESAFSGCSSLEEIEIPESVTSFGASAFAACINLKNINIPESVKTFGSGVFSDCDSLITLQLPSKLTELPENAFRYCDQLRYIVIPTSVLKIKGNAFGDCPSLESAFIPSSTSEITMSAFRNCPKVTLTVIKNSKGYSYAVNQNIPYKLLENYVNLDVHNLELNLGQSRQLVAMLKTYKTLDPTKLEWTSDNPDVASVENGIVTAKSGGTATITVKTDNGETDVCEVVVDPELKPITNISLSKTSLDLNVGKQEGLKVTIDPIDTTDSKNISWASSDNTVAIVNATGKVTAKGPGTTVITAQAENGVKAQCTVTVKSPITSIKLNQSRLTMDLKSESVQLRATLNPANTTDDKTLTWTSSNEGVATVDENGYVTAVSEGYATITVKTINGLKTTCSVIVVKSTSTPITSVVLDKEQESLVEGDKVTLHATINPSDTTDDKTLTWTSSNEGVATVDADGVVTAVSSGEADITVKTSNGKTDSCHITVTRKEIPIENVTLDQENIEIVEGSNAILNATINPENTTQDKTLTWSSENPEIATVNNKGVVTGISSGTTTITVETSNGKTDSCTVTVERKPNPIVSVSLDKTEITLKKGKQDTLKATINPDDTTDSKELTWTSSNLEVATVENGVVTAVGDGNATITVQTVNGKTATCEVHVFSVSLDALLETIERAQGIDETLYTTSSYTAMLQVLNEAQSVAENEDATQDMIDAVQQKLDETINQLEERADADSLKRLQQLRDEAESLKANYTEEEFAQMQRAIDAADVVLAKDPADVSKDVAAEAISTIETASNGLKLIDARKELQNVISEAEEILNGDISDYEPSGIEALRASVEAGKKLLSDGNNDIEALQSASVNIREAISGLTFKEVDKTLLQLLYDSFKDTENNGYTEDSWNVFQEALKLSETVLSKDKATQSEVNEAVNTLLDAYTNLKKDLNSSALDFEIEYAKKILDNADQYYASTIKDVEAALANAQYVKGNAKTQEEIDSCVKAMRELRLSIRKKPQ